MGNTFDRCSIMPYSSACQRCTDWMLCTWERRCFSSCPSRWLSLESSQTFSIKHTTMMRQVLKRTRRERNGKQLYEMDWNCEDERGNEREDQNLCGFRFHRVCGLDKFYFLTPPELSNTTGLTFHLAIFSRQILQTSTAGGNGWENSPYGLPFLFFSWT